MHVKTYGRVVTLTVRAFNDVERADAYLRSPNTALNGHTPLEALRTPAGAAIVFGWMGTP